MTGHNGSSIPTCVVVLNDDNLPITVNATNVNIPSDMTLDLNCNYYGTIDGMFESDNATSQQPIPPRQSIHVTYGIIDTNNAD